jgi:PTH1 family peptidyl-tRNA hydrolase|uniref:Peptidyl-tRNA hydrolase n=1 Tax=Desulfobacca acetoxidans TaxID=60893 RepID=A0A7C3WJN0_9BACT
MKLIVGLGNPGPEYARTRHNLGYLVVTALAENWRISLKNQKLDALWGQGRVNREPVILAKPLTYMNLSGRAVANLLNYWKLLPADLIVIHDDLDVPFGRLKLVFGGGAGGHRGVLSIMNALDTAQFYRVKLGIGRPPAGMTAEAYVLQPFGPEEFQDAIALVQKAAQAVQVLVTEGLAAAQNRFHGA